MKKQLNDYIDHRIILNKVWSGDFFNKISEY